MRFPIRSQASAPSTISAACIRIWSEKLSSNDCKASRLGVPNMTIPLSVRRSDFRRTELHEVALKERLDGPDRLSGQQQAPVSTVQNKDERAVFDEVFLPHMA